MPEAEATRTDDSLERHTGADSKLKWKITDAGVDGGDKYYEVPVTNFQWTRDYSTEQIQHNGSMKPTLGTTEIRFSGSFEYTGQNPELLQHLMHSSNLGKYDTGGSDNIGSIEDNRPIRGTLTHKEYNHDKPDEVEATITFRRVLITSHDRDVGSGDTSSSSFDWEAEDMRYTIGSSTDEDDN